VAVSLIGLRKLEYPEYTTYLSQVNDKRYHIMLYEVLLSTGSFKEKKIIKISHFRQKTILHEILFVLCYDI